MRVTNSINPKATDFGHAIFLSHKGGRVSAPPPPRLAILGDVMHDTPLCRHADIIGKGHNLAFESCSFLMIGNGTERDSSPRQARALCHARKVCKHFRLVASCGPRARKIPRSSIYYGR